MTGKSSVTIVNMAKQLCHGAEKIKEYLYHYYNTLRLEGQCIQYNYTAARKNSGIKGITAGAERKAQSGSKVKRNEREDYCRNRLKGMIWL